MTPFFEDPSNLERLQRVAREWTGTPFFANGRTKDGVSCQTLVARLYIESGFLPETFTVPNGPINWASAQTESLVERFMDLDPVAIEHFIWAEIPEPGDMLGFKIGGCVHHVGVMIEPWRFIHCLQNTGVAVNRVDDPTFAKRLQRIWRPITG